MAKTKEIDVWLQKHVEFGFTIISDYRDDGDGSYITLGKGIASIELDDTDERLLMVESLKERKDKEQAEHVIRMEVIENKIQQLLAIESDA